MGECGGILGLMLLLLTYCKRMEYNSVRSFTNYQRQLQLLLAAEPPHHVFRIFHGHLGSFQQVHMPKPGHCHVPQPRHHIRLYRPCGQTAHVTKPPVPPQRPLRAGQRLSSLKNSYQNTTHAPHSGAVSAHTKCHIFLSHPNATSSIIMMLKPSAKHTVPTSECRPFDISGISSSTTT